MTAPRPVGLIRHELETALAYQARSESRPTDDTWAIQMRDDNAREVERLQDELAQALSGELEVSLSGSPVADHQEAVPYFNKVLETLQATYRAVLKSTAGLPDARLAAVRHPGPAGDVTRAPPSAWAGWAYS